MGELSARAAVGMERRRDEIGDLVRDFNFMADRMEGLVTSQRQLISDVSHELRSPLARLNVALGLARKRPGSDPALERMEREAERLNEMIGRLLTVARLDTSLLDPQMSPVDLNVLLSEIVADAEYESRERECKVQLSCQGQWRVKANPDLLRSAIENIVRNAIRYTASGTTVDVRLENADGPGSPSIVVSVRDHGPGVPESELANIFRPFYRVSDARDRQSGGVGLGLAIADRVARLHGGSVCACNALGGGLQVDLTIPTA
jgi:signal transduction histidine kinase